MSETLTEHAAARGLHWLHGMRRSRERSRSERLPKPTTNRDSSPRCARESRTRGCACLSSSQKFSPAAARHQIQTATTPFSQQFRRGRVQYAGGAICTRTVCTVCSPAKGGRGQQGHADNKGGKFDTRLSGKGVVLGPQVVRITGGDGVKVEAFTPFGNPLFEEHTVRIDVTKDQPALQLRRAVPEKQEEAVVGPFTTP